MESLTDKFDAYEKSRASKKSSLKTGIASVVLGGAALVGMGDRAEGALINGYRDVVTKNSNFSYFNTTDFTYKGETIPEKAIIFMIKDNAYAGGMDKNNPDYPYFASGHKNERSSTEIYGYAIGEKTEGINDDVIVLIDRDGSGDFDYDASHGRLAPGSLDEIRKMSLGEVTLTGEDAYSGSTSSVTNVDVIPEPATLALLGLGGAGLAIKRRKQK